MRYPQRYSISRMAKTVVETYEAYTSGGNIKGYMYRPGSPARILNEPPLGTDGKRSKANGKQAPDRT